jgi:hypothetical protein
MPPLDSSPFLLIGICKLAAETDGSVARTRQFVLDHGCRIVPFAGSDCVVVADVRRLMRDLVAKANPVDQP